MAFRTIRLLLLLTQILLTVTGQKFPILESKDPVVNCTTAGSLCSNEKETCDKVYICLADRNNAFIQLEFACPEGQNCYGGECVEELNTFCLHSDKEFECRSKVGTYPEPGDCRKFNFCVPSEDEDGLSKIEAKCEDGYGYNYLTTFCDKPLDNNQCSKGDEVVPTCYSLGQNGPLKRNPVFYYVCMHYSDSDIRMYPYIYMCPHGKKYSENRGCV